MNKPQIVSFEIIHIEQPDPDGYVELLACITSADGEIIFQLFYLQTL